MEIPRHWRLKKFRYGRWETPAEKMQALGWIHALALTDRNDKGKNWEETTREWRERNGVEVVWDPDRDGYLGMR